MGPRCNFHCRHCIQTDSLKITDKAEVNPSVFEYIHHLAKMRPDFLGKIQLYFWGGEPLCYINIIEKFVDELHDEVSYKIITNGSLLTEDIVSYLNKNNFTVFLSDDGIHTDKVRRINVLENEHIVSLFSKINNRGIDAVISAYNQDYFSLWNYLENKFGKDINISHEELRHTWDMPEDLYDFDFDAYKQTMKKIIDNAYDKLLKGEKSREFMVIAKDVKKIVQLKEGNNPDKKYGCFQMQNSINIDLNGNMYACHNGVDILGTVKDNFDDMERKYYEVVSARDFSDCEQCVCLPICRYGCLNSRPSKGKEATCHMRKIFYLACIEFVKKLENTLEPVDLEDDLENHL